MAAPRYPFRCLKCATGGASREPLCESGGANLVECWSPRFVSRENGSPHGIPFVGRDLSWTTEFVVVRVGSLGSCLRDACRHRGGEVNCGSQTLRLSERRLRLSGNQPRVMFDASSAPRVPRNRGLTGPFFIGVRRIYYVQVIPS